ncbi:calcium-binding protein [Rhodobium gokarnense]|uniref:Ca2+-binding RTX toxin-like protein n=1 Tax=Rhodobium gokarnense TaxID=364296 RepID=A0ABT3H8I4_9HYPH|nr:calcium-binding protein [Rhodobium gokarnense]MCW2306693.1 Ca2+-binding RTX toxin-like protein [Rhodobium gokarnense]
MATPTEWLAEFQVNTGTAATGDQDQPQIVGLSNGRFLVAWQEATEGVASSAGPDIVAKIFDAEGNVAVDSFQMNALRAFDDESDFDIAADSLGGWVATYVDHDSVDTDETSIVWEMFYQTGAFRAANEVAIETAAADSLSNPQIALDLTTNDFVVTYTDLASGDTNVSAVLVDMTTPGGGTFTQSAEFDAAQNAADVQDLGDIAVLADGNYVSVYRDFDGPATSLDIRVFQPDGTLVNERENIAIGNEGTPHIASLANGGAVAVWTDGANNGDIVARVMNADASVLQSQITVASTAAVEDEPDVIALPDGGFVVVWNDESVGQRAQAYNADGTTNGAVFNPATGSTGETDISVTADGRLLFTWSEGGEIFASIWDPRGDTIEISDFQTGATNFLQTTDAVARRQGGTINGDGNANVLTGLEGEDTLNGAGGDDTLIGGDSNDYLDGGGGDDDMSGGGGDDIYDVDSTGDTVTEQSGEGTDTVRASADFTLSDNIENLILQGSANISGTGNGQANEITGNSGSNTLNGGAGNDTVDGGSGADTMGGGTGNDTYIVDNAGDRIVENGGAGDDTVRSSVSQALSAGVEDLLLLGGNDLNGTGNGLANVIAGQSGDNELAGGSGGDSVLGGGGNDTLAGNAGDDELSGGTANDRLFGGGNDDTLAGNDGRDLMFGNDGNDRLFGGGGNDTLAGNDGRDLLFGNGGNDQLFGGGGNDTLAGNDGNDTLYGGTGSDQLFGGGGNDTLAGNDGNDKLSGGTGNDQLFGGGGNDTLAGNDGNDLLFGNDGNDRLFGGGGSDTLAGNDGDDLLVGNGGNDRFYGGVGDDTIQGGDGTDIAGYGGSIDHFEVTRTGADSYDITDTTGNLGTDHLVGIEKISIGGHVWNIDALLT